MRKLGLRTLLVALLAVGLGGCLFGKSRGDPGLPIQVNNNTIPPTSLTVFLVEQSTGARQLLGSAIPGEVVTMRYHGSTVGGQFLLVARTAGGGQIVSQPFSFVGLVGLEWSVNENLIRFDEG